MTLRVACLGAGYFSQFHHASWSRLERVRLVGACDQELSRAEATGVPAFDRLERMIEATQPDVLDIVLPPVAQAEAIRSALNLGVRHIICQKPFCTSLDEARAVVTEAEAAGAVLVVHENFRFQPWYRRIRTALEDGLIGDVHQATFRLRPGDGQGPRAYLDRQPYFQTMERFLVHETAVHWIDTFRFLLGTPTSVYADLRQINPVIAGEDAGFILFDHPGGARSLFDGNRHLDHAATNHRRTMGEALVEGTRGTLALSGDGSVRHRPFASLDSEIILQADTSEGFGGDCVHHLQAHIVGGILDGTPIENLGREYLRNLVIEDAVYRSAQDGRKVAL